MLPEKVADKLTKAVACLVFVMGVLSKTKDGLQSDEIDGLVFILTDILEVFEEAKALVLAHEEGL